MTDQVTVTEVPDTSVQDERTTAINRLRALADWLEKHPDAPLPNQSTGRHLNGEEFKAAVATGLFDEPSGVGYVHMRALDESVAFYDVQANQREYEEACQSENNEADFWVAYHDMTGVPTHSELRDMGLRYRLTEAQIANALDQLPDGPQEAQAA